MVPPLDEWLSLESIFKRVLLGHSFLFVFVLAYVMVITCDLAVVTSVIATCLMNIHGSYNGSDCKPPPSWGEGSAWLVHSA